MPAIRLDGGTYMGDILRARQDDDLLLTETVHEPERETPPHRHARPYFCFVIAGGFLETAEPTAAGRATGQATDRTTDHTADRTPAERRPGALVFHPAEEAHRDRFLEGGARCLNLELGAGWARHLDPGRRRSVSLAGRRARAAAAGIRREFRKERPRRSLALRGWASLLLAELARTPDAPPDAGPAWLSRATRILREEYRQAWSLAELADRLNVSESTLARRFRELHGCSVGEFVHHLRIRTACEALDGGNPSLGALALELGFADQSHFTRIFRRHTGTTPGRYRRRARAS